jgi:high affinity sulfate transporter 1
MLARFAPGLLSLLRYDRSWLPADLAAGLSVAAVALPVGIAYSDLVGVPAVLGIYAAIFPLFAYALFGSSRQLITGPDSATCVLVAASLGPLAGGDPQRYAALVVILTLVTGAWLLVAGVLRLGFLASFLSQPILTGFLNAIALIIIAGQLKTLFGYAGSADDFFPTVLEFATSIPETNAATFAFGLVLLTALLALRRWLPRAPAALLLVVLGIFAVEALRLDERGITVLGIVPAGLPSFALLVPTLAEFREIAADGAAIALMSFISGALTAQSFARRNRYAVDANQELVGLAACNFASGLAQAFPVSGTDSRTAVNDAMGGKSQMTGVVAGAAMLVVLFFLTAPLASVPKVALAAVIIVSATGLFDFTALRELYATSRVEFVLCVASTSAALVFGVLPGVGIAVGLSLLWLLHVSSRPVDEVLVRVEGLDGYHDAAEHPNARPIAGVLIYRFNASLVFFNADRFKKRVHEKVAEAGRPIEWVILDASPVNYVDITGMQKLDELREELQARGITVAVASADSHLSRYFSRTWLARRQQHFSRQTFPTVDAALRAYARSETRSADQP